VFCTVLLDAACLEATKSLSLYLIRGHFVSPCDGDTDEIVVDAISQAASGLDEVGEDDSLADLLGKTIEERGQW
jgi:hypothetical protein